MKVGTRISATLVALSAAIITMNSCSRMPQLAGPSFGSDPRYRHYPLKTSISADLPGIQLRDFYSEREIAFLRAVPNFRFVGPTAGLRLRAKPARNAKALATMSYLDKFYVLKVDAREQTISGLSEGDRSR